LVKLLQRELLRLAHEDEREAEGEDVRAGVEAWFGISFREPRGPENGLTEGPGTPETAQLERELVSVAYGGVGSLEAHAATENEVCKVIERDGEGLAQLPVC
jgi:hypothetical protein